MNRRRAFLSSVLLLLPCHAEEKKSEATFATHVTGLPPCDRVEVVRLEEKRFAGEEKEPVPGKLTAEQKGRLHYITRVHTWFEILGKVTVKGADAERLAVLFRSFPESHLPKPPGLSLCHYPPYLYRFHAGDKLVGEASVCWRCHTILTGPEILTGPADKREFLYFEKSSKQAKELLEASDKLFPKHPAKE